MTRSITRWTTSLAAAALLALPAAGLAQTPAGQQPTQPPAQPPTSTQPPTSPPETPPEPQARGAQVDADAAKQHLTAARNALSEMTQLPAASQLTGDARTQVSQLIASFNELITAKSEWKSAYQKVDSNLDTLIGDATTDESAARASGTAGAVGTSGSVALDPALKAKLIEVRNHLDKFEQAAGGGSTPAAASGSAGMSGSAAATTPPATGAAPESQQAPAAQQPEMDHQELLRHVQAIEAILNVQGPSAAGTSGTTGTTTTEPQTGTTQSGITLSAAQVDQLRNHLTELKRLLNQR
jgi:hypothetical protein